MPQARNLTPAEVATLEYKPTGQRKLIEKQYDTILSDYAAGDYGEALLEPDENRLTVRNRLRAGAVRRGLGINFRRTDGDRIRFQIVDGTQDRGAPTSATVVVEPPAPVISEPAPKKRRGRPKKVS